MKAIKTKKRTLREITNIINRMRELGAISVKVDDIEVIFELSLNKAIPTEKSYETADMADLLEVATEKKILSKEEKAKQEEDELFLDK